MRKWGLGGSSKGNSKDKSQEVQTSLVSMQNYEKLQY